MEWLTTIRWILGGAAMALGAFVALGNWLTLIKMVITEGSSSFIPILGGSLAFLGLLIIPVPGRFPWLWVPLVADWGCVPMWSFIGISLLKGGRRNEEALGDP